MQTFIVIVLIYAAIKATFKRLTRPAPYEMQLVSRPPATRESRGTNTTTPPEPFELWEVKAARYEAQRKSSASITLADYYPSNLKAGDLK